MMRVPFYGHVRQYHSIKREIDSAIFAVLESNEYVMGPALSRFEGALATYCDIRWAVGVNSGTDALWIVLKALGIRAGDEVITTANTFFATAEAIWIAGGTAVFVDCDPQTRNIDPGRITAAITPRTRGIIPVHLYGLSADMQAIREIADAHRLWVVEDAAQAIGGHGPGWKHGSLSDAVSTSFVAQKNLGTFGDGGAVLTNRDDLRRDVHRLRNHGSEARSVHSLGYNSRLDDLHAAVLEVKLRYLERWTERRREIAQLYTEGLAGTSLRLPSGLPGYRHVYHLYVVEHPLRDDLQHHLAANGVETKVHYPIPIHRQQGYPWSQPAVLTDVTNCERNAASCLSLPMFPELGDDEVAYTIEQCRRWARG